MWAHTVDDGVCGGLAYSPEPVPLATVRDVFEAARRLPSWQNPRGWHISVLTGAALQRFKDELTQRLLNDVPGRSDLDVPETGWPELCLLRTVRAMAAREEAAAIANLEGDRTDRLTRLGQLFGAPCAMIYSVDCKVATSLSCFNSGTFINCMCDAAHDEGLSTCVLATAVKYPEVLRALLPSEAGKHFAVGVALGYSEMDMAVPRPVGDRMEFADLVSWVE
jgi:nitroreductase